MAEGPHVPVPQLVVRSLVVLGPDAEGGVRGEVLPGHLPESVAPGARGGEVAGLLLPYRLVGLERLPPLPRPGYGVSDPLARGDRTVGEEGYGAGQREAAGGAREATREAPPPVEEPPDKPEEAGPGGRQPDDR